LTDGLLDEALVIDLSTRVAGAYCCQLFAHLGAEVVKAGGPSGVAELDAGKKSVTLDRSKPEGREILLRLAEHADVVVTEGLPDLDYATLSHQNPRLVLTLITPPTDSDLFGQYLTGLNAFAATLLPLVNMSILGRGQEVRVDGEECLASAAFAVDAPGEWPTQAGSEAGPPFRVEGLTALSAAPRLGEHNDEVYCGLLGLSGEELARQKEAGVV
jgi:crotonobetainyl-CoA:carnitine CoA-transferase CaiB-like acyl-CoA transferase